MHGIRDRLHLGQRTRAIVDVTEHDERGLLRHRCCDVLDLYAVDWISREPAHGQSAFGGDALGHEPVGGEVPLLDEDFQTVWKSRHGGTYELVEQHGRGVGDDRLARCGPDRDPADAVAELGRQVHPLLVPRADEARAPVVPHELGEALGQRSQRPAERVAVEVGADARCLDEGVQMSRERVMRVEALGFGEEIGHVRPPDQRE